MDSHVPLWGAVCPILVLLREPTHLCGTEEAFSLLSQGWSMLALQGSTGEHRSQWMTLEWP